MALAMAGAPPSPVVRVMVCDDSAVIRSAVTRILEADPGIRVVARADHGQAALAALKLHDIDVVVLDIEMPVMDGLTALPLLLAADPRLRVIMASTLTTRGADISMRALRLGAADFVPKPTALQITADERFGIELVAKVRGLARLRLNTQGSEKHAPAAPAAPTAYPLSPAPRHPAGLLAVGSSTGGPNALFTLIQSLPARFPLPVVMTQHMPATFTPILAGHIGRLGGMPCVEASDGARLQPGHIVLAPGDRHLLVRREGGSLVIRLSDGPAEHFCRPSVNPMLRSACEAMDGRVLMVMLTGMGNDGLEGTRQVVEHGGAALAQDEATSVVWGMPGAIVRQGLAHAVLPLAKIGPKILSMLAVRS
jgi:two-component system chemotaxis response regulator CheB